MMVLPVLDILHGRAVHAQGGHRDFYAPVASVLHEGANPVDLARACRDVLGVDALYLADLDAIAGRTPNHAIVREICGLGMNLLLDGGVRTVDDVSPAMLNERITIVAGLETVANPEALAAIVAKAGADRVAFSLDLRDGVPLVPTLETWGTETPRVLARIAIDAGVRRVIVLDLARVGEGRGVGTSALLRTLHRDHPQMQILAGGGVAGPDDLRLMREAGASGVLVGSALHDGRITAATIRQARADHPAWPASS